MGDVLLTDRELAHLLRVSMATFYRWKKAGTIPGRLAAPIPNRWDRGAVLTWLETARGLGAGSQTDRETRIG